MLAQQPLHWGTKQPLQQFNMEVRYSCCWSHTILLQNTHKRSNIFSKHENWVASWIWFQPPQTTASRTTKSRKNIIILGSMERGTELGVWPDPTSPLGCILGQTTWPLSFIFLTYKTSSQGAVANCCKDRKTRCYHH